MLRPKFDSTFFVAFKLTHEALDAALKKASELNITQYRVLVKLLTAGTAGLPQKDVSALLDLKPNVVTQAINTLEERGSPCAQTAQLTSAFAAPVPPPPAASMRRT